MKHELQHPIDVNGFFHLALTYDPDSRELSGKVVTRQETSERFLKNLGSITTLTIAGQDGQDNGLSLPLTRQSDGSYGFRCTLADEVAELEVRLNDTTFGNYLINGAEGISGEASHKLVVFETRILGRHAEPGIPYPRPPINISEELWPKTDLHTHLSAQIASRDLVEIGMNREGGATPYPTAFLDELGIDYDYVPKEKFTEQPHKVFIPLKHTKAEQRQTDSCIPLDALKPEDLQKLEQALHFEPDRQSHYPAMELRVYRMREPMTKDLALLKPMLERIAKDYDEKGIKYAELQTTSMVNPTWLRHLHSIMPEIEERYDVQMRFIQQIPRSLYDEEIHDMVEKTKAIAASPYFTGIQSVGYELNKTSDLAKHYHNFARYARDNQPGSVMGSHSGETSKNLENIREFLEIADQYGLRSRVGHVLYGLDEPTLEVARRLADKNLIITEVLADSNMALNNVDVAGELTIHRLAQAGIPFVLSSDGAGIYLTSPEQLAQVAMFAGATLNDLRKARGTEEEYISYKTQEFTRKQAALPPDFLDALESSFPAPTYTPEVAARYKADAQKKREELHDRLDTHGIIHDPASIEADIADKACIFLNGAAGGSLGAVSAAAQRQMSIAVDMLVNALDPEKVFLFNGRPKNDGITRFINDAVERYNNAHPDSPQFIFMNYVVEAESAIKQQVEADATTHIYLSDGNRLVVVDELLNFTKAHDGISLSLAGGTFTRNIIHRADVLEVPMGLMLGPEGASTSKAKHMDESLSFRDAKGMVEYVHARRPELFAGDFELSQLPKRYHDSHRNVVSGRGNGFSR